MKRFFIKNIISAWKDTYNFEPSKEEINITFSIIVKLLFLILFIILALFGGICFIFTHALSVGIIVLCLLVLSILMGILIGRGLYNLANQLASDERSEFYKDIKSKEE